MIKRRAKKILWRLRQYKSIIMRVFYKSCKDSQIEFYLIDAFEIFHFLPFYYKFNENNIKAVFVAEPNSINLSGKWFNFEQAKSILSGLSGDVIYYYKANKNAKYVFTTQTEDVIRCYGEKTKKITLHYGASLIKDNFSFSLRSCQGFDYVLTQNRFQIDIQRKLLPTPQYFEVGYPKHLAFLERPISKKEVIDELGINTSKLILVYLPTWDEDFAGEYFSKQILSLKEKYYIVVKMHHCLERLKVCEPKKRIVESIADYVLEGNYPFEKAVTVADCVLCDAKSGASLETALLNSEVPIVLLSVRSSIEEYYPVIRDMFSVVFRPQDLSLENEELWNDSGRNKRNEVLDYYAGKKGREGFEAFINYIINEIKRDDKPLMI